jgi:hypothetical protein
VEFFFHVLSLSSLMHWGVMVESDSLISVSLTGSWMFSSIGHAFFLISLSTSPYFDIYKGVKSYCKYLINSNINNINYYLHNVFLILEHLLVFVREAA